MPNAKVNAEIPAEIQDLWKQVDDIWEQHQALPDFESYASADFEAVYESLSKLDPKGRTFLELGSGLGVVTIMASRLGFKAYGIDAKAGLVDYSRDFANEFAPNARFGVGSFIPDAFEWDPGNGDEAVRTFIDVPDAYGQLDMSLCDFDLIYAYPWPTEHDLYNNFLGQFARRGAQFLTYDAREGMDLKTL